MDTITKFEVGKTYFTRSICDHECIYRYTILGRTEKTVTVNVHGKVVRRKLGLDYNGTAEIFYPHGRYSMAAIIRASRQEMEG